MKNILISLILSGATSLALYADENKTQESNLTMESNRTIVSQPTTEKPESNSSLTKKNNKNLDEQMKKEEKYAKEQRFYQGDEYDLSAAEVDPNSLSKINLIEPDYDFVMDDVYD